MKKLKIMLCIFILSSGLVGCGEPKPTLKNTKKLYNQKDRFKTSLYYNKLSEEDKDVLDVYFTKDIIDTCVDWIQSNKKDDESYSECEDRVTDYAIISSEYDEMGELLYQMIEAAKEGKVIINDRTKVHKELAKLSKEAKEAKQKENTSKDAVVDELVLNVEDGIRAKYKKGRGRSDDGREEPNYVGTIGYLSTYYDYVHNSDSSYLSIPWTINTYSKDKQFYVVDGSLPHKTEVIVREQMLEHEGYGRYSGYLNVEKLDTKEQYIVDVSNYITKPYWEYNVLDAAKEGECIVEFNQLSNYYPVSKRNEKIDLEDGSRLLLCGKNGSYPNGPSSSTHQIEVKRIVCVDEEYETQTILVNEADLKIVY